MGDLASANRDLEGFSYSVSHDLRAPLRAIDGFSRMLGEDYSDRLDEEGRRYLEVISENTRRMGRLIDDLLDFSRLGPQDAHDVRRRSGLAGARDLRRAEGSVSGARDRAAPVGPPRRQGGSRHDASGAGQSAVERDQVHPWKEPGGRRGGRPGSRRRDDLLRARQRDRLRHEIRAQALRRVPASARVERSSRERAWASRSSSGSWSAMEAGSGEKRAPGRAPSSTSRFPRGTKRPFFAERRASLRPRRGWPARGSGPVYDRSREMVKGRRAEGSPSWFDPRER